MMTRRDILRGGACAAAAGCIMPGPVPERSLIAGGWQSLLEGGSPAQWRPADAGAGAAWTVSGTELVTRPLEAGPLSNTDLITVREDFDHFNLYLQFRVEPGAASGVVLRGAHELRLADTRSEPLSVRSCGALLDRQAPSGQAELGAGRWQSLDATLQKHQLTVLLNGRMIHDRVDVGRSGRTAGPLILRGASGGAAAFRDLRWRQMRG